MKKCGRCSKTKDIDCFHKRGINGTQSVCKECKKEMDKKVYLTNPRKRLLIEQYKSKIFQEVRDYKANLGCKYCPERESVCLEFHHLRDKNFTIGQWIGSTSPERLWKEIEKCIVVCANCHKKLHAGIIDFMPL